MTAMMHNGGGTQMMANNGAIIISRKKRGTVMQMPGMSMGGSVMRMPGMSMYINNDWNTPLEIQKTDTGAGQKRENIGTRTTMVVKNNWPFVNNWHFNGVPFSNWPFNNWRYNNGWPFRYVVSNLLSDFELGTIHKRRFP